MKWLTLTDAENVTLTKLIGCVCFFLFILTCCVCMLRSIHVDAGFLWPVIAVICAFASVSAASFAQFRTSDYGFVERKGEADAKVAAATKAVPTQPVVQSPAPAVEIHS